MATTILLCVTVRRASNSHENIKYYVPQYDKDNEMMGLILKNKKECDTGSR